MDDDIEFETEIRQLLSSGEKIAAVKRYREVTGVGLAEAKSAVDAIEAGKSLTPDASNSTNSSLNVDNVTQQIVILLENGQLIEAIKLHRTQLGSDLKTAKAAVEQIRHANGIQPTSGIGCLGVILAGITIWAQISTS